MNIIEDSLTIVLLGDWNKYYIQPDWVAENIFGQPEMEIGVDAQGIDFNISYRSNNIIINPSQERIVITATNTQKETVENLANCATNYITKAVTPRLLAYGLNVDFVETDNTLIPNLFDSIADAQSLIELNYDFAKTQIQRTLIKEGNIVNVQYTQENNQSKIHFNEHHAEVEIEKVIFSYDTILKFIKRSKEIVVGLGYELEEDENE